MEITPGREYLLVTEFFKDAVEIGQADVGDAIIDQGLAMIGKLWDAGIAHRDIKPGNLMVRAGELLLIDVAFAQVRPSPWRQAVDLGNMMLVLALRSDPQQVYRGRWPTSPPTNSPKRSPPPAGSPAPPSCAPS